MGVLFTILMQFLASCFTKIYFHAAFKIAITLSFITLVVSSIYAYVAAYSMIVNGIAQTVPWIVNAVWGWFMPSNINLCILAIMSCYVLRFLTKLYFRILNFKFKASISN
jgi:hypothetical protein